MAEWEITLSTNDIHPDSDLDNLKRDAETPFPNYALTLPRYSKLNGEYENAVVDPGEIGYMSNSISDENGLFQTPIVITMEFVRKKISKGVNFVFNRVSGDYCNHLNIKWYSENVLLWQQDYHPDGVTYYAQANVSLFTRLEVTFYSTSKPYRRLWLAEMENNRLMQSEGLVIRYGDVAYMGKESTTIVCDDAKDGSNIDLLLNNAIADYPQYAMTLPRYSKLDGAFINMPDDGDAIAYISEQISDANGDLDPNDYPSIEFDLNQVIGSIGIELFFNNASGDYCTDVNIQWFLEGDLIHSEDYEPDDTDFFCPYICNAYDKLIITFKATSKPYRNVYLRGFYYGRGYIFTKREIVDCDAYMEIAPIGESLPANSLDFKVRNEGLEFRFEKNQKFNVMFDGQLIGNYYLKTAERQSEYIYRFYCEDIKSVLANSVHVGGFYNNANVETVITQEIFNGIDTDVYVDDSISNLTISGWLPYGNCRDNLAQICFALGAIMDVSFGDGVYIYAFDNTLQAEEIEDSKIYYGKTKISTSDIISGVELNIHSWEAQTNEAQLYKGVLSGEMLVIFNEPKYDLSIENGTINSYADNYAIIAGTGNGETILKGKSYKHVQETISRENEYIYQNKKVAKAKDATLITSANGATVLDRLYEYYSNPQTVSATILLENQELSNIVSVSTFDGNKRGIIQALDMEFYGEVKAEVSVKCLT